MTVIASLLLVCGLADGDDKLVGRWTYQTELMKVITVILPDGRYFAEIEIGGNVVPERGTYTTKTGKITFDPRGEKTVTYPYTLAGDTFEVAVPEIGKMTYKRTTSAKDIVAEMKEADAIRAADDAAWRKRFAVGVMKDQPPHAAGGAIPDDKNVKRVFDAPTVFVKAQQYTKTGKVEYVFPGNNPPGVYKAQFDFYFLPTGRVYVDAVTYAGGLPARNVRQGPFGTMLATGKTVTQKFGRYRIDKDEAVTIEFDDGEKSALQFIEGRRSAVSGKEVYGNVVWELEALKKALDKK